MTTETKKQLVISFKDFQGLSLSLSLACQNKAWSIKCHCTLDVTQKSADVYFLDIIFTQKSGVLKEKWHLQPYMESGGR